MNVNSSSFSIDKLQTGFGLTDQIKGVKSLFINRKNNTSLVEKTFTETGSVKLGERTPTPDLEKMRFMCQRSQTKHGVYNDDFDDGPPLILPKFRQVNIPKRLNPSFSPPFGIYNSDSQDLNRRTRAPSWTFRKPKTFSHSHLSKFPLDLPQKSQFTTNQSSCPNDQSQPINFTTSALILKPH